MNKIKENLSSIIDDAIRHERIVSGKEIAFNLNQVIKELESIDQDTIDANSHYMTSVDYVNNLINRLYDVYFERQKCL